MFTGVFTGLVVLYGSDLTRLCLGGKSFVRNLIENFLALHFLPSVPFPGLTTPLEISCLPAYLPVW